MKLEIDFNNRQSLVALKDDLEKHLKIINHALSLFPDEPSVVLAKLSAPVSGPFLTIADETKVSNAIDNYGHQDFTIKGVEDQLAGAVSGSVVRRIINRQVEEGKLILVKAGAGRAPSIYRRK